MAESSEGIGSISVPPKNCSILRVKAHISNFLSPQYRLIQGPSLWNQQTQSLYNSDRQQNQSRLQQVLASPQSNQHWTCQCRRRRILCHKYQHELLRSKQCLFRPAPDIQEVEDFPGHPVTLRTIVLARSIEIV